MQYDLPKITYLVAHEVLAAWWSGDQVAPTPAGELRAFIHPAYVRAR